MKKRMFRNVAAVCLAMAMTVTSVSVPAQAAGKLSVSKCTIALGDSLDLNVIGAKEKSGKYTSSKKKVAAVNKKGVVKAKKAGNAKITWKKSGKKYVCKVKVVKAPTVSASKIQLEAGQTKKVSVKKYGVKKLSVKWSSADQKIATVNAGTITGVSAGKTKIKAKIKGYKKTWTKSMEVTVSGKNGGNVTPSAPVTTATSTPEATVTPEATATAAPVPTPVGDALYKGYTLKWEDNFDADTLNRDDWNVELHEPGWVNNELQSYVDSTENIYTKDGKLVLKPVKKVDADGKVSYTSGRVNTQNKHDYKYGLFEARIKFPAGKGFLPAFWMMPTDENLYGQWPRCGEIDISEVLGDNTKKTYGTIHYGTPYSSHQGDWTLETGDFAEEYHDFALEWEPGKLTWYVDGIPFYTTSDWYTAQDGEGEITYPAPYDQPFYVILNLAVGGTWPGDPDETTDFDKASMMVDYVKIYQKDSYDENVEKPKQEVVLRDPDKNGNYINNGDFATAEDLADEKDWVFMEAEGGKAAAEIKDREMQISTEAEGSVDYSVQLVQAGVPMKQGGKYELSFDAYADAARSMKVNIKAPDYGYKEYFGSNVDLTKEKQTYRYEFTMTDKDDANGRLEYNMGAAGSTAAIHISNVTLKKTGQVSEEEINQKGVLRNGNYVYNGEFQEGSNRLAYWTVDEEVASVTNVDNIRRLKVVVPAGTTADNPVLVSQKSLALQANAKYALSFDLEGESGKNIIVAVAGKDFQAELTGKAQDYNYKVETGESLANKDIVFRFSNPGTYYLDNVRIVEDSLIKNGKFDAGLAGYEAYVDGSANATCVVDSLTEENAADWTIRDTGDAAWKIQLKQNNIELEKGQWYRLSFDAKSSMDRKLMFAIQRDGSADDDWTPYSGEKIVDLGSEYQRYDLEFSMKNETDLKSILSISMGAVGGTQIKEAHRICIDNINLEKIDAPEVPEQPAGENMLKNGNFSLGSEGWENAVTAPGAAEATFDNKAVYNISNVGTADWNVQLKQSGFTLEKGSTYKVTFKASSTKARTIKLAMLTAAYDWYGGADIELEEGKEKDVECIFTVDKDTDTNMTMVISMGVIEGKDTPLSTVTLSDFQLVKVEK